MLVGQLIEELQKHPPTAIVNTGIKWMHGIEHVMRLPSGDVYLSQTFSQGARDQTDRNALTRVAIKRLHDSR